MGKRKPSNRWGELDDLVKELALEELDRFTAQNGPLAAGALTVQSMQLLFTQMGWKVTRWVDEAMKARERR